MYFRLGDVIGGKLRDTGRENQHGPAAGNGWNHRRTDKTVDFIDQVTQERRHTEAVLSQRHAVKRWYFRRYFNGCSS